MPGLLVRSLALVGLLVGPLMASKGYAQPATDGPRRILVLSDLHMGAGRAASGEWDPREDFRWADDLRLFLEAIAEETDIPTDLIFNGDTFDLVQSSTVPCAHERPELGCSEEEALARIDRVLSAHVRELSAIGAFAGAGDNRVVLVPGEHDASLLFTEVGVRAVDAFPAPSDRVVVATEGAWRSADGLVLVEHGHQLETRTDRFESWPLPFIDRAGQRYLTRSSGQQAIQPLFDEYETRFSIIDNFADEMAGLGYALSADGTDPTRESTPVVLRELLFRFSWQQFRMDLDRGDVEAPVWRLDDIRADGPEFILSTVPDDDRLRPMVLQAFETGQLEELLVTLSDDDLRALCDYRAAVRRARRRFERILTQLDPTGPVVSECPRTRESTGPAFEYFWQSRDRTFQRHLEQRRGEGPPIAVFVHGHTHLADYPQGNFTRVEAGGTYVVDGFSPVRDAASPIVINGGAWQRTVTPVMLDRFAAERGLSDRELLEEMRPEQLPPCYSFVEIPPYTDLPAPPVLRYWREGRDGQWMLARGCGRRISDAS